MAKPEWGAKRTCHSCGARFYDLRRETIVCPVCSTVYDPERHPRTRRGGGTIKDDAVVLARVDVDAVKKKKAVKREAADDDVVTEIDDEEGADTEEAEDSAGATEMDEIKTEDGDLIEDTSDLGEDDDDIGEVMEHLDGDLDDKH